MSMFKKSSFIYIIRLFLVATIIYYICSVHKMKKVIRGILRKQNLIILAIREVKRRSLLTPAERNKAEERDREFERREKNKKKK